MSKVRQAVGLAAAIALACTAAACSSGTSATAGGSTSATDAGTLTLGGAFTAGTFNPWLAPGGDNEYMQLEGAVYDSLTHVGPAGQIEPGLAVKWAFSSPTTRTTPWCAAPSRRSPTPARPSRC